MGKKPCVEKMGVIKYAGKRPRWKNGRERKAGGKCRKGVYRPKIPRGKRREESTGHEGDNSLSELPYFSSSMVFMQISLV